MDLQLTQDETILGIIALVRDINLAMLKVDGDGFTVDFAPLSGRADLCGDEQLLVKLRAANEGSSHSIALNDSEALRLARLLEKLEALSTWPEDVMAMSRSLRSRLAADHKGT